MRHPFLKLIFLVPFLFGVSFIKAQIPRPDFEINYLTEFQNKKNEVLQTFLYSDATGHYALFAGGKYGDGKKTIRKFDFNFQPTNYRMKLEYPKKTSAPTDIGFLSSGKQFYHFWQVKSREGIHHFVQEIDLSTQAKKDVKKIATIDYVNGYSTSTESRVLQDDSKQMYLATEILADRQESVTLRIDSFDENLRPETTFSYNLPHPKWQFKVLSIHPYQDNSFILIGKNHFSENIVKSEKRKEYEYHIYELKNGEAHLLKTISPNNFHINGLKSILKDNHLIIAGFLNEHDILKPSAIYAMRYNVLLAEVEFEKSTRLPDSFYNYPEIRDQKIAAIHVGFRNKKKDADRNYVLKELYTSDNNDLLIVAEQNFINENNVPITNGQGMLIPSIGTKTFYSNDITVLKVDKEGNLMWNSKIIKRQQWGGNPSILSYFPVFKNNKLFLFYNGNYLNLENSGSNFIDKNDAALI
ncbi:MAG: hypothetical protein ACFB0A_15420 [Croceivirga sp.]